MRILKNDDQNDYLCKNGFILLDCLRDDEIELLNTLYIKWHKSDKPIAFYKSYFSDNTAYKEEVEREIIKIIQPKINNYFMPSDLYGGMFVVKPHGENGHLPPHQDWSFVSEKINWSLNMWSPLADVNAQNGNMKMIPGSHNFMHTIRGFNTKDQYLHQKELLENLAIDIPMKKGELIFFFHGIIHGSTKNMNNEERVSIGLSVKEKSKPTFFHYYHESSESVSVYLTDLSFYKTFRGGKIESGSLAKYLGKTGFTFSSISDDEIKKKAQNSLDGFEIKRF